MPPAKKDFGPDDLAAWEGKAASALEARHPKLFGAGSLAGNAAFHCLLGRAARKGVPLDSRAKHKLFADDFFVDWLRETPTPPREAALGALGWALLRRSDAPETSPRCWETYAGPPAVAAFLVLPGFLLVPMTILSLKEWSGQPWTLATALALLFASSVFAAVRAPSALRIVGSQIAAAQAATVFRKVLWGSRPSAAAMLAGEAIIWAWAIFCAAVFSIFVGGAAALLASGGVGMIADRAPSELTSGVWMFVGAMGFLACFPGLLDDAVARTRSLEIESELARWRESALEG